MFGPKKQTTAPKPNGVDNLIHKLKALPPAIDLIVAATLGGYSFVAIYVDNAKFVGLACILIALIFAVLGISAVTREMKDFKVVEQNSTSRRIPLLSPMWLAATKPKRKWGNSLNSCAILPSFRSSVVTFRKAF